MALGSTQPLTEMSTRSISWGKGGRCVRLTTLPPSCAVVTKSRSLNFLEPSGPVQTCNGTALPFRGIHLKDKCQGILYQQTAVVGDKFYANEYKFQKTQLGPFTHLLSFQSSSGFLILRLHLLTVSTPRSIKHHKHRWFILKM